MMMDDRTYRTSDIALAAFLLCAGFHIFGVDPGRKAVFRFDSDTELPKQVMVFVNGQASVEPSAFLNNLKMLKGMANGY